MVAKLKALLLGQSLLLAHDWIYDSDYYEKTVEGPAARSAGRIADSILSDFKPANLIDVGCGTGVLLEALRERGCEVFGLEYAEAALRYCRNRKLNVAKFDLERDVFNESRTFDVAVSMEVAEQHPFPHLTMEKTGVRRGDDAKFVNRIVSLIKTTEKYVVNSVKAVESKRSRNSEQATLLPRHSLRIMPRNGKIVNMCSRVWFADRQNANTGYHKHVPD